MPYLLFMILLLHRFFITSLLIASYGSLIFLFVGCKSLPHQISGEESPRQKPFILDNNEYVVNPSYRNSVDAIGDGLHNVGVPYGNYAGELFGFIGVLLATYANHRRRVERKEGRSEAARLIELNQKDIKDLKEEVRYTFSKPKI